MAILRTDIERALNELRSQEEGMRFQGLAVVLGKKRWPELIARQRKKDFGLDAYAPATLTSEKIGKGLASSITPTLEKVSGDAEKATKNFKDLKALLFVTSTKVGNAERKEWEDALRKDYGLDLHLLEREEIITLLMMPENASLCASFLHLDVAPEQDVADLVAKTRRAAAAVTRTWEAKTKGQPLIELTAVRLDANGAESAEAFSLANIDNALMQSRRVVLEGPAGRGKTTTLIQLADRARASGTTFIVELPAWTSSRRGILEYIAGMRSFQAEGLSAADLARVQQTEPFLFLLNGWNEVTESNSAQANDALRELDWDLPGVGIIIATRTHHLTPPLPGALRLRLQRLRRGQRAAYSSARLGAKAPTLRERIEADAALDELTRSPFVLSEVAALFEAGVTIPTTKIGVLGAVIRLQEEREEHRNVLHGAPIFGRQTDYLKALALSTTRLGAVSLVDANARTPVAAVARKLADGGQIGLVGAPDVLTTLAAHHVLERVDYPQIAYQFEHQQLQEYYAALDVRAQLVDIKDDGAPVRQFIVNYVNDPAWAEPLRMIAETFAEPTGDGATDKENTQAGRVVVEMALAVDPVFAGELAQLCGPVVWQEVRTSVGERLRAIHAFRDGNFREYALAAMLATGSADFEDVLLPLLSSGDQQVRLHTYRLWPDIGPAILGPDWRKEVGAWPDEVRADFVSEMLRNRLEGDVAAFAVDDGSAAVKKAAASSLLWTRSDDATIRVLESMDDETFADVVRDRPDSIPAALRNRTVVALRKFIESTADQPARLRTALDLIEIGETGLDAVVKDAMAALTGGDMRNLGSHYIQPALEYLRKTDPSWASEWVAIQVAKGALYGHEHWLPFAPAIPDALAEKYLRRLETEDLKNKRLESMSAVIAARADARLAARVFTNLRELRRKVDAEPGVRHEHEWQLMNQLEVVFRGLPADIAAAGALSSVTPGDALDIKVAADLFGKVARSNEAPLDITDPDLRSRLRGYMKGSLDLVLRQEDFNGEEKANLASVIAQVGEAEDLTDLLTLIRADMERVRRGSAAREAGDRGPLGNGASWSHAGSHIEALIHLDARGIDQTLIDLLPEPEYTLPVAEEMARSFLPKPERSFDRTFRFELMWGAREGRLPAPMEDKRRARYAAALDAEIRRLFDERAHAKSTRPVDFVLIQLASALAAVDANGATATVLDVVSLPGDWEEYRRVDALERLLVSGVILPSAVLFALVDRILARTDKWMQDSDKYLLRRALSLCAFADDPAKGIAKIREVLAKDRFHSYQLREIVTAVGESRSDAAVDLLLEIASNQQTFEQCEDNFFDALAALDTPRARELLIGFIDPDVGGITLTRRPHREDVLVARLTELAGRDVKVAGRLRGLCERDLPELNRHILSKVMNWLGTPEALAASLQLIDDGKRPAVPQGIWDQLQGMFVERRPYGDASNVFTQHPRAANDLRARFFRMAAEDPKRSKAAFTLLGQIEEWRLEYGRPTGEPRHPDLASAEPWPPKEPKA